MFRNNSLFWNNSLFRNSSLFWKCIPAAFIQWVVIVILAELKYIIQSSWQPGFNFYSYFCWSLLKQLKRPTKLIVNSYKWVKRLNEIRIVQENLLHPLLKWAILFWVKVFPVIQPVAIPFLPVTKSSERDHRRTVDQFSSAQRNFISFRSAMRSLRQGLFCAFW